MIFYHIAIQNKERCDRFVSSTLYTYDELSSHVEDPDALHMILVKEFKLRYPDERLLSGEFLKEEIKNMEIIGYLESNFRKGL